MKPWWYKPTAEHLYELEDVNLEWMPMKPYLWRGWWIVADWHLPDGTRQRLVRGQVPDGLIINNAHIIGENSLPDSKSTIQY